MNMNEQNYPMLQRLGSSSRAALVSYLFAYALSHRLDAGAFQAWMTAGQAFDPWRDTRNGRDIRR